MTKVNEAIIFATKAHAGQKRKGKDTPYITHPLSALVVASSITSDEDVLCASVLHDVVEDTPITIEEIERAFGKRVAELVASDSEDKMRHLSEEESWKTRKQATLDLLENATRDEQIICIADKLANIREMAQDYFLIGDKLWEKFNQKDKAMHGWYYLGIAERLTALKDTYAYKEYEELCNKIFKD